MATLETVEQICMENGKKLDIINGTVARHKGNIKEIFKRLRGIEDNEVREEGVQEGKRMMKTSTRNMIIVVAISLGCLFAGIRTFQSSQAALIDKIVNTLNQEKGGTDGQ